MVVDVVLYVMLMWGKSLFDESLLNFLGIYVGVVSVEWVCVVIEGVLVLVIVGVVFIDMVSGFFS